MNLSRRNKVTILNIVLVSCFGFCVKTQAQVQTSIAEVIAPIPNFEMKGIIYPQFWKAVLKDQLVFVPLEKVIAFGIQDYEVTGGGHVHELTIAMQQNLLVRIYAVEAPTIVQKVKDRTSGARNTVETYVGEASPVTNLQTESVVKHYPETTHKPMMEFRVKSRKDVGELYLEFEKAYLDFQMRELIEKQRNNAVRKSTVSDR